ncbi:enoyl-CoA hydratase/E-phenylitaconyl-CoA hydratase [Shimia gijangensis]|uniref:Enoyl-CoA hydratase/E-phenylitaconyl-CoA hydratase n=1 Tax=Shimia gijangensis TaxID=1470563 RepID=A0A1M6D8J8_9RHOB|nr:enoyl-CoA hydratase/isomerase family protein [Shimia gijangensis]SHI69491.1 enoyl-CoA hydratase/E-phenylitaconyl-CoA hydratase [Shimia gijangensis]
MPIRYETSDGIAKITIDKPPLNVFTPVMHKELYEALREFTADAEVRCGILTGAGSRAFSAGDDIKTPRPERTRLEVIERHLAPSHAYDSQEYPGWEHEFLTMARYKPIVAAVQGYCFGQGFIYLNHLSDFRYASTDAVFGMPEIAYGMGGAGGALSLGKMIPHTAAMELLLLGDKIDAATAERMFLINAVVELEKLMENAEAAANKIASHPPLGIRVEMESYQRGLDLNRADSMAMAGHMYRMARAVQTTTPPLAKKDAAE